jgi:hypothetical protein
MWEYIFYSHWTCRIKVMSFLKKLAENGQLQTFCSIPLFNVRFFIQVNNMILFEVLKKDNFP